MIFSSCQKEELNKSITGSSINTQISSRSSTAPRCGNIIRNSNFNQYTEQSTIGSEGFRLFSDELVDDWECFHYSADLVGPFWKYPTNSGQFWDNYIFEDNYAFLGCGGTFVEFAEAIKQDVNVKEGIEYCLSFDYSSTAWPNSQNGSLFIGYSIGEHPLSNLCGDEENPIPTCGQAILCEEVPISSAVEYPTVLNYENTFVASANASSIMLWAQSNNVGNGLNARGAFVTNIQLRCEYKNLTGVDAVSVNNDCRFTFNPVFTDPSQTQNLKYTWVFGDGNFLFDSNVQNPTHTYASAGIYDVKLIIKDENGCCAEYDFMVSCMECQGWICHEGDAQFPSNAVGHYKCATGMRIVHPFEGPKNIDFQTACYNADLDCVAKEMELALHAEGFPDSRVYSSDPMGEIVCTKAGIGVTKGIFVYGDIEVLYMYGTDKGYNGQAACNTDPGDIFLVPIYGDTFNPCN